MAWEGAGEITPYTIEAMAVFKNDLYLGTTMPPRSWIYRTTGLTPSRIETAAQDISAKGKVTGSYLDTQTGFDLYETIAAGADHQTDSLEHTWKFNITGGSRITFAIQAYHTDPDDDLFFSYSRDDKTYHDLLKLTKTQDDQVDELIPMPSLAGDLFIRARNDLRRTDPERKSPLKDTLYVDHMYILSEGILKTPAMK